MDRQFQSAARDNRVSLTPIRSNLLQRKCACGSAPELSGQCDECSRGNLTVQRRAAGRGESSAVPPVVHDVLNSSGQPLDNATRGRMESGFGHDFSRVRIHTDGRAVDSARAVNALAYTVGQSIVFAHGQYAPHTREGQSLIAHELAHTIQQGDAVRRTPADLQTTDADDASEREADAAAAAVMQGRSFSPARHGASQLARQAAPPAPAPAPAPGAAPGVKTDAEIMDESNVAALNMMTDAWVLITSLRSEVALLNPITDPKMQNTLRAVQTWLHINLATDSTAGFLSVLDRAIKHIENNLAIRATMVRVGQRVPPCKPGDFALAFVGNPGRPISCCDQFFTSGPECRRNVLTHERFHLAGLHHGEAGQPARPPVTTTPEQALDSADDLMDLVKDVTGQRIFACPNF